MNENIENDVEKLGLIHPPLIEEINRYRDWPIRILTFTSAFYFGFIGLFLLNKIEINFLWVKIVLTAVVTSLCLWTVYWCGKCHLSYLMARNIQVKIQKKLKLDTWLVDGKKVFPDEWFSEKPVTLCTRLWGWGFYAFYATILFVLSLMVIWGVTKFIKNVG